MTDLEATEEFPALPMKTPLVLGDGTVLEANMGKVLVSVDISDGVETHIEFTMKDGICTVFDMYEIVDGKAKGDATC